MPRGLVKAAAISIIPWTMGSLLSPLGEPHLALLALPLAALVMLIAAVRLRIPVKRPWIPWMLCALLCLMSGVRFLALPFFSEWTTGSSDFDEAGAALRRVLMVMGTIKIVFYLASGALLLYGAVALVWRRRLSLVP